MEDWELIPTGDGLTFIERTGRNKILGPFLLVGPIYQNGYIYAHHPITGRATRTPVPAYDIVIELDKRIKQIYHSGALGMTSSKTVDTLAAFIFRLHKQTRSLSHRQVDYPTPEEFEVIQKAIRRLKNLPTELPSLLTEIQHFVGRLPK